jgi:thioredoxin 1
MITKLDKTNFQEKTKQGLKLVEFYADWCGYCTRQAPILEELDKIWIGKINTDENRELAQKYGISSLPSFIIFKDGKEIHRFSGLHTKFDIMAEITKYLT